MMTGGTPISGNPHIGQLKGSVLLLSQHRDGGKRTLQYFFWYRYRWPIQIYLVQWVTKNLCFSTAMGASGKGQTKNSGGFSRFPRQQKRAEREVGRHLRVSCGWDHLNMGDENAVFTDLGVQYTKCFDDEWFGKWSSIYMYIYTTSFNWYVW